ncbi:hypothetical protein LTR27_002518 [Elasticomyces elasticus]|nr:hypothetical protein LTR27_002518 [Elasticomyces elasticus]
MAAQNDQMREIWETVMHAELRVSDHYSNVAVLILHWAEALDKDLKVASEVKLLAEGFKHDFGFDVKVVQLDDRPKRPQLQLDKAMTDFVYDNDGDHGNHLLIVYYTGHGFVRFDSPHELIISGTA